MHILSMSDKWNSTPGFLKLLLDTRTIMYLHTCNLLNLLLYHIFSYSHDSTVNSLNNSLELGNVNAGT